MTLPEQIDVSNAGQIREALLSVINRGATSLIADMTATISCDHAVADAVVRACQRAILSGHGAAAGGHRPDRPAGAGASAAWTAWSSIYPSLEAATAARRTAQ